jgi:hypothetical protein
MTTETKLAPPFGSDAGATDVVTLGQLVELRDLAGRFGGPRRLDKLLEMLLAIHHGQNGVNLVAGQADSELGNLKLTDLAALHQASFHAGGLTRIKVVLDAVIALV